MASLKKYYRQSLLMGSGTIINSLLGLVFYLLVARTLPVSQFGQFSYLLGLGLIAAEIGDLGFSATLIKFGGRANFAGIFTLVFLQRLVISSALIILGLLLGRDYYFSALAGASLLLMSLVTQSFLARQQYKSFVLVNIFGNLSRLGFFFIFKSALWAFSLANFFGFIAGLVIISVLDKTIPWQIKSIKENFLKVRRFTGWTAVSFSLSSLSGKIDIPLIFILAGGQAAGIYASAQKLVSVLPQIAASLEGVFAPKFSQEKGVNHNFRDYLFLTMAISIGLIATTSLSSLLIPALFGQKYLAAIPVFNLLLISFVPFFLSGAPAAGILYGFGKVKYHLFVSVAALICSVALYFYLVPGWKEIGAATTAIIINFISFGIYLFFYKKLSR